MAEIRKIGNAVPVLEKRKRVAAYARVSLPTEQMLHSLSTQVSYYSSLIQKNPEWEYAGVYVDNGITGTSAQKRREFLRLLSDCDAGKIDLILTKSISRFARNTVDLLESIRHLKKIGVEVRFEEQGISTFSGDGELMLTLLASIAQAESESISTNEKWAVKKKFENGEANTSLRSFGYDWDKENGCCVVNEEEARWVRYIYDRYLSGASIRAIEKEMAEKGVKGVRGEALSRTTIRRILSSELYTGDMVLQKYYSPAVRKYRLNRGEVPKYVVSEAHEGIVSREDFDAVQKRMAQRAHDADNSGFIPHRFSGMVKCGKCGCACSFVAGKKSQQNNIECRQKKMKKCDLLPIRETELEAALEENVKYRDVLESIILFDDHIEFRLKGGRVKNVERDFPAGRYSCFTGKIRCGGCGKIFVRVESGKKDEHGERKHLWICGSRRAAKSSCSVESIAEEELVEITTRILAADKNYKTAFYSKIGRVDVYNDRLDFIFKEGGVQSWQRK